MAIFHFLIMDGFCRKKKRDFGLATALDLVHFSLPHYFVEKHKTAFNLIMKMTNAVLIRTKFVVEME